MMVVDSGATSGIGAETARVLAKRGARLVVPARSLKAAEDAKARIASECPGSEIVVMALDLSSLTSIRNFVAEFESLGLPLHLLMYVSIISTRFNSKKITPANANSDFLLIVASFPSLLQKQRRKICAQPRHLRGRNRDDLRDELSR